MQSEIRDQRLRGGNQPSAKVWMDTQKHATASVTTRITLNKVKVRVSFAIYLYETWVRDVQINEQMHAGTTVYRIAHHAVELYS